MGSVAEADQAEIQRTEDVQAGGSLKENTDDLQRYG